jgi:hypothetical protein
MLGTFICGIIFTLIRKYLWDKEEQDTRESSLRYQMYVLDKNEMKQEKNRWIRIEEMLDLNPKD